MGRIRAEESVDAAEAKTSFTVRNLFPMVTNTVIAMAKDDTGLVGQSAPVRVDLITGREYTGTAWQGSSGRPAAVTGAR